MTHAAVYHIWRGDELLYIGASYNPWVRFGAHQSTRDWARSATRMDIEWYPTREAALRAERLAIAQKKPAANTLDVSGDIARKGNCKASALIGWLSASGLTQAEFAEKAGVHFTALSRILNGKRLPTKAVAARIHEITYGAVPVSAWGFQVKAAKDPKTLEALKALSQTGMTRKDIAEKLGVSAAIVSTLAEKAGVEISRKRPASKYEDALRDFARLGLIASEAARRIGVSPAIVSATAKRCGIEFKDGRKKVRQSTLARVERVRTLAASGLTLSEVSRQIGVSQPEISRMKKTHGIKFRAYGAPRAPEATL